jgi:hypothetical protein
LYGFLDMGLAPLGQAVLAPHQLDRMERFYPLKLFVCRNCWLVQLQQYVDPSESPADGEAEATSEATAQPDRSFVEMAIRSFGLDAKSLVVELASNDGHLLSLFRSRGMAVLGLEPSHELAAAAKERGVPTIGQPFSADLARHLAEEGHPADLVIGNSQLAQSADLHSLLAGIKSLLKPFGVATVVVPHVVQLFTGNQFDSINHRHFSYASLMACQTILGAHGLEIFDVEQVGPCGGSLRLFICHGGTRLPNPSVAQIRDRERAAGFDRLDTYAAFGRRVVEAKHNLLDFLINARRRGKSIAAYGAAANGNTLLNYCGIRGDFIDYSVDHNPAAHGTFLPGSRIPVYPPERLGQTRPDYVLILPWTRKDEIIAQLQFVREWGGQFVLAVPNVAVVN